MAYKHNTNRNRRRDAPLDKTVGMWADSFIYDAIRKFTTESQLNLPH